MENGELGMMITPNFYLTPNTYHLPPTTYHLTPNTYHLTPTTYHLIPIGDKLRQNRRCQGS
ncbi:MAG: hypothetical protein F6J96_28200 [Symploca sp. SIO1C2]|nr:hypothetical protein [Symploca sp. SIO1C2]